MKLPKFYLRRIWRTIMEFEMLEKGDKVVVGLSGGKDSLFLLYALKVIQTNSKFPFELAAATIDLGFGEINEPYLREYCERLSVPFYLEKTDIAAIVEEKAEEKSPCSTCSFYRRGALVKVMQREDKNVLALAHHQDDAVETFLMSLLYSGQIKTFLPTTYLDKSGIRVIRPLVYLTEAEVKGGLKYAEAKPVKNPCPYSGNTQREYVKNLLKTLIRDNPNVYTHLLSAMREGKHIELWPKVKSRPEMHELYLRYMGAVDRDDYNS
jgi:tRNA 2-thiocytidine biosynthesis protein TtcA